MYEFGTLKKRHSSFNVDPSGLSHKPVNENKHHIIFWNIQIAGRFPPLVAYAHAVVEALAISVDSCFGDGARDQEVEFP